jgi:DEAD/DEAH box helicase domain-containing protein
MTLLNDLTKIVRIAGSEISEFVEYPEKAAELKPIPSKLNNLVKSSLEANYPAGLYKHQSLAIEAGIEGKSVCIATPTASGKTLIFTSIVINRILEDKSKRTIVLYPARALIQDQFKKWKDAAVGTNLEVNIIDGSIQTAQRDAIISKSNIVLMTPDVLHAWFLSKQDIPTIQVFSEMLKILVLDEAHAYEGIFGTNMVYLLHRLRAVCPIEQIIASTATIGNPKVFLNQLTGFDFTVFDASADGSHTPAKTFAIASLSQRKIGVFCKTLINELKNGSTGKFLIFAESRKRVEEIVSDSSIELEAAQKDENVDNEIEQIDFKSMKVLPYRSGYEDEDRLEIQDAITNGALNGVVATSALELGIDIGEINLVVILGVPPSIKSFWQRAGRTARKNSGFILLLDINQTIEVGTFSKYLIKPPENNWLYLDNEYLQYANALCAAEEQSMIGAKFYIKSAFEQLPKRFTELLDNEIDPLKALSSDLYSMKQQMSGSKPHLAFPVRTGIERQYKVINSHMPGRTLGNLTYSQLMNEAFPGAIYRYFGKPYRVYQIKYSSNEIKVNLIRGIGTTTALKKVALFPNFANELIFLAKSEHAFYAEVGLQASERVIGFIERWGATKTEHNYNTDSTYTKKPLNKYFTSSGICLYCDDEDYSKEKVAKYLSIAFCRICSVNEREIGFGVFHATKHPLGEEKISGIAIYDSVNGSLRLTSQFTTKINEIFNLAQNLATSEGAMAVAGSISLLGEKFSQCKVADINLNPISILSDEWVSVIKGGSKAAFNDGGQHINEDVDVLRYAYTPNGLVYFLKPRIEGVSWQVAGTFIKAIPGISEIEYYNISSGEINDKPVN